MPIFDEIISGKVEISVLVAFLDTEIGIPTSKSKFRRNCLEIASEFRFRQSKKDFRWNPSSVFYWQDVNSQNIVQYTLMDSVLRIRDVLSRISDPDSNIFSFRIMDPTWKVECKLFPCFLCLQEQSLSLSHVKIRDPEKNHNGSGSRIQGVKKAPNPQHSMG
jgi:hypothetical protein